MKTKETVAIAMSGGVDSSVAAALLIEQGYEVIGLTMHLWEYSGVGGNVFNESSCCSIHTIDDARSVCHQLGIPHYVINLKDVFQEQVIQNFIDEYLAARTPNPCVLCNSRVKWGSLLPRAVRIGADKIATGHYARCEYDAKRRRFLLKKGLDGRKEQSYALWGLTQEHLAKTLFPLGQLTKIQVREKAAELNLKTAQKSESQEICFIPDDNYERFLKEQVPGLHEQLQHGEVINEKGEVLGEHRGYPFYTIGQRKGLRVAAGHRIYVNRIDPQTNRVYVGPQENVYSNGLKAVQVNWVSSDGDFDSLPVTAKIRYNDPGFAAELFPLGAGEIELRFLAPHKSVTPGQSAVFYRGDLVVGGGIISGTLEVGS